MVTEREPAPSTILDCTSFPYVVVREGAIPVEELREVIPSILTRAEADEQAARKVEEAQAPTQNESNTSNASQQALDEQEGLDEAYEQWDSTHTVSGDPSAAPRHPRLVRLPPPCWALRARWVRASASARWTRSARAATATTLPSRFTRMSRGFSPSLPILPAPWSLARHPPPRRLKPRPRLMLRTEAPEAAEDHL